MVYNTGAEKAQSKKGMDESISQGREERDSSKEIHMKTHGETCSLTA